MQFPNNNTLHPTWISQLSTTFFPIIILHVFKKKYERVIYIIKAINCFLCNISNIILLNKKYNTLLQKTIATRYPENYRLRIYSNGSQLLPNCNVGAWFICIPVGHKITHDGEIETKPAPPFSSRF